MSKQRNTPLSLPEDKRFFQCLVVGLCVWSVFSVVVPFLTVPEKSREELEALPPQLTQFVLKQKLEEKKKPKPIVKKELEKKEPDKKIEKKEVAKKKIPEPKPKKPVQIVQPKPKIEPQPKKERVALANKPAKASAQERAVAREQASQSGVLAMQQGLASLVSRKTAPIAAARLGKVSESAAPRAKTAMAAISTGGSGGKTAQVISANAVDVAVVSHETARVQEGAKGQVLAAVSNQEARSPQKRSQQGLRDESAIRKVFERNKAAIYSIYARAQRKNEDLAGKLVLEIQIGASGRVETLRLIESELADKKLEKRIMTRVKMFTFGEDNVSALTMRYTFDFVAS